MQHATNVGKGWIAGGSGNASARGRETGVPDAGAGAGPPADARKGSSRAEGSTAAEAVSELGAEAEPGPLDAVRAGAPGPTGPAVAPELAERFERLAKWRGAFEQTVRSLPERLTLLHDFGLTDHDLAAAIPDGKARAVRRWRTSGPPSTRVSEIWRAVDDLYYMVSHFLADGSLDEAAIIAWLR